MYLWTINIDVSKTAFTLIAVATILSLSLFAKAFAVDDPAPDAPKKPTAEQGAKDAIDNVPDKPHITHGCGDISVLCTVKRVGPGDKMRCDPSRCIIGNSNNDGGVKKHSTDKIN
jgi:hypothetical protein